MTENASTSPAPTDIPEADGARPRGRRRVTAMIVGGALLFAGGAGTGAVVGTALSSGSAQAATGPGGSGGFPGGAAGQGGPGGQMPGGTTGSGSTGSGTTGTQTGQAPSGTAPSGAPSTAPSSGT